MTKNQLAKMISTQIPLSKAMGLKVESASASRGVIFNLPLKPNRNHKNTAFGGTLVAAQALACWAWLMVFLNKKELDGEVVIQRQTGEFLHPVPRNFKVHVCPPSAQSQKQFLLALRKKRKARIEIYAEIICKDQLAASFRGEYVAVLK